MLKRSIIAVIVLICFTGQAHGEMSYEYVAFGDSITQGCCDPLLYSQSFVGIIQSQIGYAIDNQAIGGTVIANQIQQIQSYSGQTRNIIWLVGYNDMRSGLPAQVFADELNQGLDLLSDRSVYLGLTLKMTETGYTLFPERHRNFGSDSLTDEYNQQIIEIASHRSNVFVVDTSNYNPVTMASDDLVHPNALGYQTIANDFLFKILHRVFIPLYIYDSNFVWGRE